MLFTNKKIYLTLIITIILVLLFLIYIFSSRPTIVMSYFVPENHRVVSSKNENEYQKLHEQLDALNVLAYAFLHVHIDGKLAFSESDLTVSERNRQFCKQNQVICAQSKNPSVGDFDFFSSLQNRANNLKKIVSLGGADDKTSFLYAINHIDNFVNSASAVINEYHLSGLDFDYEIGRPYQPQEGNKFAELVAKLRKKLGPKKLISVATIIDQETLKSMGNDNWKTIARNANYISMMCYDFISPQRPPEYTQLASNLYPVTNAPSFLYNANASCDQSINYLITIGVPAHKIVLGIPAYAIAYGGVGRENDGLFQPSRANETPSFDDMGKGLLRYTTVQTLNKAGFIEHVSKTQGFVNGVWSYNPKSHQFITFDNRESVRDKMDYVGKNNLAGVMIWRIGQDVPLSDKRSLLKAIDDGVHR